ncbi:transcriptional regulator, AraC family [Flavobacterium glycines]|uniref:AraC family transcriptional regulator n=1 Tax=Flavobacterium glycines TaxID=551990 RepID=A0A1B9DPL4_9FLAO|nr:AraC family transcriptional regulator [Flavobacterium glycines]OCB71615.1 AraC family transcriptional regulator [Flavobacterium glycines]GEL10656.1 AraC family transcriptional regulator [Flavobacterium glycines]SDI59556.1 transcriptional regulator, AraC family [Flavobacterium glycines]
MKSNIPTLKIIEPSFGSSFTLTKYDINYNSHFWHYHPEIELIFVNGGAGKRQVGSHISYYNNGDLTLIGSNLPHCGFTDELTGNKNEIVIQMKPEFLGENFFDIPEMRNIKNLFNQAKSGITFGGKTKRKIGKKIGKMEEQSPFERLLSIIEILNELELATEDATVLNAEGFRMEMHVQDNERINLIFNYVKDNFKEPIRLDDIAGKVSMTVPSFCRYFKKITHKTFTKFVNDYRLVHACKLLAEKPISITEIAFESGFNNFSHFNKTFKEFTGKNASDYRHELKSFLE